jgi:hypothetical protein
VRSVRSQGALENDRGYDQNHPVRRENPQGAVPEVPARVGCVGPPKDGCGEGPVEEEARQYEEEDDAVVEVGRDRLERAEIHLGVIWGREQPDVGDQDASGRDSASPFDSCKPQAGRWRGSKNPRIPTRIVRILRS